MLSFSFHSPFGPRCAGCGGRLTSCMDLNHTAAMLSPMGLKTFVFAHRNSFPDISTRNLLSMANMAVARTRPIINEL